MNLQNVPNGCIRFVTIPNPYRMPDKTILLPIIHENLRKNLTLPVEEKHYLTPKTRRQIYEYSLQ